MSSPIETKEQQKWVGHAANLADSQFQEKLYIPTETHRSVNNFREHCVFLGRQERHCESSTSQQGKPEHGALRHQPRPGTTLISFGQPLQPLPLAPAYFHRFSHHKDNTALRPPRHQHHLPCAPGRTRTNPRGAPPPAPGPAALPPPRRPQRVPPVPGDGDTRTPGDGDTGTGHTCHPQSGHHGPPPSPPLPGPALGGNQSTIGVSISQSQRQRLGR